MKPTFRLQDLLQQGDAALSATSTFLRQGLAVLDCTGVEALTPEQLTGLFAGLPDTWSFVELSEVIDVQTLFALPGNDDESADWGEKSVPQIGNTVLDRIHQSLILFAAGRSEALKRFLVEDGVGQDQRFWRLAQALSALYPTGTDEKRWVDGVLARKKGLGF